jgi:hypothetical protein
VPSQIHADATQADPTLGPTRLQMLIDSLASGELLGLTCNEQQAHSHLGIDVFNDPLDSRKAEKGGVDEVGVIVGS